MHIGIFIYGLTWGGATRRLLSLARAFRDKGHSVSLIVVDGASSLDASEIAGLDIVELNHGLLFKLLLSNASKKSKMAWSKLALARYLRTANLDLLISGGNHAHITALTANLLAGRKIPLILRLSSHIGASLRKKHSLSKKLRFWEVKLLYPSSDMIIAVSKAVADDLRCWVSIPEERIRVIHNPVYSEDLLRKAEEDVTHPWLKEQRGEKKIPVLLAAGRLNFQKGFDVLIKAFAIASKKRELRLIILGEGKKRHVLERLARDLGVADRIDMPGFVKNPLAYMARAELFCHASKYEGSPGVLIEALAAGCPVVCTDSQGGAREILDEGKYGILVPVGEEDGFAKGILEALDKGWNSVELRRRAAQFSVARAAEQYLHVLNRLLIKSRKSQK